MLTPHLPTGWHSLRTAGRVVFWPLLIVTLLSMCLEAGLWKRQELHTGPFAPDPFVGADRAGVSVGFIPREENPFPCCLSIHSGENEHPYQSDMRLWINGTWIQPIYVANYDEVRMGRLPGFTFWDHRVVFGLPSGVANDATTTVLVRYALWPPRGLAPLLTFVTTVFGLLVYYRAVTQFARRFAEPVLWATNTAMRGAGYLCIAASVIYLASILYAWMSGWALPTTAPIRSSSVVEWFARKEVYLGHVLLVVAAFGICATWLRSSNDIDRQRTAQDTVERWLWPYGAVVMICLLVFAMSGMWTGIARPGDFQYANLGGMVPYSDSASHLAAAYDQVKDGVWSSFALRRPLAAAFRSVLLFFAGDSLPLMQILQVTLLAVALCFATWSVARWSGPWTALVFFALTYMYARVFAPLTLTEALGLIWALMIIPFTVEALRTNSLFSGFVAFTLLVVGLMTRMGSMFTIPAFLLWLIFLFGHSIRDKVRIGAIGVAILLGVVAFNTIVQHLYGTPQTNAGSNFPYVLCGLTLGTAWDGCIIKLSQAGVLPVSEVELTRALYATAWENFRAHPGIFFARIVAGAQQFFLDIPDMLFRGYLNADTEPHWFPRNALLVLSFFAAIRYLTRSAARSEISFWVLFSASLFASAGIVYFDDGKRALAVTYPLMFLFIARVVSAPACKELATVVQPDARVPRWATSTLGTAATLLLIVPWIAHTNRSALYNHPDSLKAQPSQAIVLSGRRLAGFLVVADNTPLRNDVPSLHLSDFEKIIDSSGIEASQGLIHPQIPPLPFGFVFAPRAEKDAISGSLYIVPSDVIERRDVQMWRWSYRSWQQKPSNAEYWFYVTHAEPVEHPQAERP